ncbi:MAG: restriction endonuclease [Pyrinomonadaceae bacterium]
MSIPTYDKFIEPMLRYLARHSEGAPASVVYEAVGSALNITENDKLSLLPSRTQPVYKNRAGWAHDRLKRAGLSSSPRRGYWKLTETGLAFAQNHQSPLSEQQIKKLSVVDPAVRLRPLRTVEGDNDVSHLEENAKDSVATPDDLLESALSELEEATAGDLLETIGRGSPKFFENLVLDLLHAMGYGASRDDLQHVGRSHDEGIDGIISLDRLGLEKVFVQAKRWQGSVGREAVQAFYGALAGQRANKGVLITTSSFTPHAVEFARSIERIVLIDGARLTDLMMEYGVGVSHRTVKIPKIDSDYFEE